MHRFILWCGIALTLTSIHCKSSALSHAKWICRTWSENISNAPPDACRRLKPLTKMGSRTAAYIASLSAAFNQEQEAGSFKRTLFQNVQFFLQHTPSLKKGLQEEMNRLFAPLFGSSIYEGSENPGYRFHFVRGPVVYAIDPFRYAPTSDKPLIHFSTFEAEHFTAPQFLYTTDFLHLWAIMYKVVSEKPRSPHSRLYWLRKQHFVYSHLFTKEGYAHIFKNHATIFYAMQGASRIHRSRLRHRSVTPITGVLIKVR